MGPLKISESSFQTAIIDLAKTCGWMVHHTKNVQLKNGRWMTPLSGMAGFPDLVLVHHRFGGPIYAEIKTSVGRLSPAQQLWRDTLISAGAEWHLWRPKDIDEIKTRLIRKQK
jgi:hypothetical protein